MQLSVILNYRKLKKTRAQSADSSKDHRKTRASFE